MKVFRNTRQLARIRKPLFLTIGTYDGVHRGHLKVLKDLTREAKRHKGISCVLTFKEHPWDLLHPKRRPKLLTSNLHRLLLLDRAGVDGCLLLDFTKKFSEQTPEVFIKELLVKELRVREVHLGYKSRFGFHRQGDTNTMRHMAEKYGFTFKETAPFKDQGTPLSSTLIRELIQRGDLKEVSRFLGRPYSLLGVTVKGQGLGKQLGFPTANLDLRSEIAPPLGVYAVTVNILKFKDWIIQHGAELDSRPEIKGLRGVMNVGFRPTVGGSQTRLVPEVHLLDHHKNLTGRILEVTFHQRIRDEKRFKSLTELKSQILKDVQRAKRIL